MQGNRLFSALRFAPTRSEGSPFQQWARRLLAARAARRRELLESEMLAQLDRHTLADIGISDELRSHASAFRCAQALHVDLLNRGWRSSI